MMHTSLKVAVANEDFHVKPGFLSVSLMIGFSTVFLPPHDHHTLPNVKKNVKESFKKETEPSELLWDQTSRMRAYLSFCLSV